MHRIDDLLFNTTASNFTNKLLKKTTQIEDVFLGFTIYALKKDKKTSHHQTIRDEDKI